jgi:hypothetical protein
MRQCLPSNRAKSWSCEHCANFQAKHDPVICKTCFWASPENYLHIAETPSRRVDLVWTGNEVASFERLKKKAGENGLELVAYIKQTLSE